MLFLTH